MEFVQELTSTWSRPEYRRRCWSAKP